MNFLKWLAREWNDEEPIINYLMATFALVAGGLIILLILASKGIILLVIAAMYILYKAVDKFFKSFETEE